MDTRGVVVGPTFTFDGTNFSFPGLVGIDPLSLRYYLLYWDKIEYPNNNLIHIGSSADDQFLESIGVMSRTTIPLSGFSGNIGTGYVQAQVTAFRNHDSAEPGIWSMAQSGVRTFLPPNSTNDGRAIEIELYHALPVAGPEIPLADILEFKTQRAGELAALRTSIDELYADVISSGDIPRSKNAAISRIELALSDLRKVTAESWSSRFLSTVKGDLSLPNILSNATTGAAASIVLGFPLEVGAMLGAATAALKLELKPSKKLSQLPDRLRPFIYAHHIEKELKG